jgi:hypothetical protein
MDIQKFTPPNNLREVINGDQTGYTLVMGYHLIAIQKFPAVSVFGKKPGNIVFTDDLSVLEDIWKLLSLDSARIHSQPFYVNKERNICFEVAEETINGTKDLQPTRFITREIFNELINNENHKFEWPGAFVGPTITFDHIAKAITSERSKAA